MATPIQTPNMTMIWRAESVPGTTGGTADTPTSAVVPLAQSSGAPWLGAQVNGVEFRANELAAASEYIYLGYTGLSFSIAEDSNFVFIQEFDVDYEENFPETYINANFQHAGSSFGERMEFTATLNNHEKHPITFSPFKANADDQRSPVTQHNLMEDKGVVDFDWTSNIVSMNLYTRATADQETVAPFNHSRMVGIGAYTDRKPVVWVSWDHTEGTLYSEAFQTAKLHEVPIHVYVQSDQMEGGATYSAGVHCTDAQLLEMYNYRTAGGNRLITFGPHGDSHATMSGINSRFIGFTAPSTINLTSGNDFARIRNGITLEIEGGVNDGKTVTVASYTDNSITVNETNLVTEAAPTDFSRIFIRRNVAEMEAEWSTCIAKLNALGILGDDVIAASTPFGDQTNDIVAYAQANNFGTLRTTSGSPFGNQQADFLAATGLPPDPLNLRISMDLGNDINTFAEYQTRMSGHLQTGGLVGIYAHIFGDGISLVDILAATGNAILVDVAALRDANTITLIAGNTLTNHIAGSNVPNIVGSTAAEAAQLLQDQDLVVGTVTNANSLTVPAGEIISQVQSHLSKLEVFQPVDYTISDGPAQVTVPDVVGQAQATAEASITGANLTVGNVTNANSPTVVVGSVISQTPVGGASADQGSAVNIVVSLGPVQVTVPDVANITQAAATAALQSVNLTVGNVTSATSQTVASGLVISQNPSSGQTVDENSAVDLVISTGPNAGADHIRQVQPVHGRLTIFRKNDVELVFPAVDKNGPIDITGFTGELKIASSLYANAFINEPLIIKGNPMDGVWSVPLSNSQTDQTGQYFYEVVMVDPNGKRTTLYIGELDWVDTI